MNKFSVFLQGWIVASKNIREQRYTVQGLQPSTSYLFLVRAQNSHGPSLPSRVTDPITTKGTVLVCSVQGLQPSTSYFFFHLTRRLKIQNPQGNKFS